MKDFDFIIIGGGCAGLSLAYELEIHKKLENKSLAIMMIVLKKIGKIFLLMYPRKRNT